MFRRAITVAEAQAALGAWHQDIAAGIWRAADMPASVFDRAEALAARRSPALGTRSLNVLHVASALELGASLFFTYDQRQAALARSAGRTVRPARLA